MIGQARPGASSKRSPWCNLTWVLHQCLQVPCLPNHNLQPETHNVWHSGNPGQGQICALSFQFILVFLHLNQKTLGMGEGLGPVPLNDSGSLSPQRPGNRQTLKAWHY